jgi:N-methylhydantoinase B/oxoprolinase/acetone carboxylase alpha subunit
MEEKVMQYQGKNYEKIVINHLKGKKTEGYDVVEDDDGNYKVIVKSKSESEAYEPKLNFEESLRKYEMRNGIEPPKPSKLDRFLKPRQRSLL